MNRTSITRAGEGPDPAKAAGRGGDAPSARPQMPVSVRELGTVPFDGVNLPLIAVEDGESGESAVWIATQAGAVPPWPLLLADDTADSKRVPGMLRVMAFRAERGKGSGGGKDAGLRAAAWVGSPPRGVILGRSADARGFLVESPRPDGSRWIGRVDWTSGAVEWLAGGPGDKAAADRVNAFATLGPRGQLAYSRRDVQGRAFELVVKDPAGGEERALHLPSDESVVFPTFAADADRVYAIVIPEGAGPARVIAVECGSTGKLRVGASAPLTIEPTIIAAWQMVSCLTTPWPRVEKGPLAGGVAMFSLEHGGMVWVNGATGAMTPLAKGSVGAVGIESGVGAGAGFVLGAAEELVFESIGAGEGGGLIPGIESAMMRGAFVPRGVWGRGDEWGVLAVSPPRADTSEAVGVFQVTPEKKPSKSANTSR